MAYQYAKEAFPDASFLKVGLSYPLPEKLIRKFAAQVEELWVVEELDPFMEEQVKALGIDCYGKDRLPLCGELNPDIIRSAITGAAPEEGDQPDLPPRPPSMCPGCPPGHALGLEAQQVLHRRRHRLLHPGISPPLSAIDACLCMGRASTTPTACYGLRSGEEDRRGHRRLDLLPLGHHRALNLAYNKGAALIVILDNSTTAMTGSQDHPGTGITVRGEDREP